MKRREVVFLGLLAAGALGGFLLASHLTYRIGFPLDDSWIHQTYARNLAWYGEWAFVRGTPSAGSTSPLWSLLLALGHWLGAGPYIWTYLLGWLVLWGMAVLGAYAFGWLVPEKKGWRVWAGALVALEWHLAWAAGSGMETLLFALLVTWVLVWLVRLGQQESIPATTWLGLGGVVGLSVWVRPEGITLLGPLGLGALFLERNWRKRVQAGFFVLTGFALLFAPYLLFNQWLAGSWMPNTFFAKQAEYTANRQQPLLTRLLQQCQQPLVGVGLVLLPGFLYLLYKAARQKRWETLLGPAWLLGHLTLYALRLPVIYQHGRYVMPGMSVLFAWGAAGMALLLQLDAEDFWRRVASRVGFLAAVFVLGAFYLSGARAFGRDVAFIESEMVEVAFWVAENTEPEDLIAAHDIGALGYFAQRPLLDLAGLVSPDVIPFLREEVRLAQYIDAQGARYLVTFPSWYDELPHLGEAVFAPQGGFSQAFGGEHMTVYRWRTP